MMGVSLRHRADALALTTSLMDASPTRSDDSWLAPARVELALGGRLRVLRDFTCFPDGADPPTLVLGAGVLHQDLDVDDPVEAGRTLRWTADVSFERPGATFMAAVVGNRFDPGDGERRDQLGALVQGGVFVGRRLELFARYDGGDADGLAPDLSVVTAGLNLYFSEHTLKWTLDVGYGFNEVAGLWASGGAGWLADAPGADGQVVVRSQIQMLW